MKIIQIYRQCKKIDASFALYCWNLIYYRKFLGKNLFKHPKTIIKGLKNIEIKEALNIGVSYVGFVHKNDTTFLNVSGKLIINGRASIGRGARLCIGKDAIMNMGDKSYINPFTKVIITHGLEIGNNCAISWNCQILDEDFHVIEYEGKKEIETNKIVISDHVWIGSGVSIYRGTFIAKGCVVAANSVVKGAFNEENTLIAGNPARMIKHNIIWK